MTGVVAAAPSDRRSSVDGARLARRSVEGAFVLLIAVIAALGIAAGFAVQRIYTLANDRYLKEAAPIFSATQDVLVQMLNQETAVRGYVVTADPSTLAPYRQGRVLEARELDAIQASSGADPDIPRRLPAVRSDVAALEGFFAHQIALVRSGPAGQRRAEASLLAGKARFDHFRTEAFALESAAGRVVQNARNAQHDTFVKALAFLIAAGVAALAIAFALLLLLPRRLSRLYQSEAEARRAAEEGADAARALAHVAEAVVLVDDEDTIRYWNPGATRLFGVDRGDALGGRLDAVAPTVQSVLAEPGGRVTLDGRDRWLAGTETPFDGGRVIVLRDLTPDHELERVRSEFVATAAHELRTPLAAIYGAVRTIRRPGDEIGEVAREQFLAMIETESERLRRLMEQLLATAQLDRGALQIRSEPVALGPLCDAVVAAAALRVPASIELATDFADGTVIVQGDGERLRQAVENLVDNAVKYSPSGGRVELRVLRRGEEGVVLVSDEGIGIPAEEQERVFEKFYRLDPSMTRGVGGSGLGLHIIRELVTKMGGEVTVESELGRGATFEIALPLAAQ